MIYSELFMLRHKGPAYRKSGLQILVGRGDRGDRAGYRGRSPLRSASLVTGYYEQDRSLHALIALGLPLRAGLPVRADAGATPVFVAAIRHDASLLAGARSWVAPAPAPPSSSQIRMRLAFGRVCFQGVINMESPNNRRRARSDQSPARS
jgi:hypothetical protein